MRHPYKTKYLEFQHVSVPDRKTPIITVYNHVTRVELGLIKWSMEAVLFLSRGCSGVQQAVPG